MLSASQPKLRTRQRFPNIAGCDTSMTGERYRGPLGPTELAPTRALKPRRLAREKVAYQQRCAPLAWVGRYALALLGVGGRVGPVQRGASIDELLDRAVAAINRGDRVTATALAGQVLAVDRGNADATAEQIKALVAQ
jgi:hypothetical protein